MYEPPLHRVDDLARMHALIRERVFGLLISNGAEGIVANSVPFVLDAAASKLGALKVHVARANSQWRDLQSSPDALVVFQGARPLHHPVLVRDQAGDRQGRADLELHDGPGEGAGESDGRSLALAPD